MGEARRRGTYEERVAQGVAKRAEMLRWAPAAQAARRDPKWRTATRQERREMILNAARLLGIA